MVRNLLKVLLFAVWTQTKSWPWSEQV